MKLTLILMRHGEAADGSADHARRLTKRGVDEARSVARQLLATGRVPNVAFASDAARVKDTCDAVRSVFGAKLPAVLHSPGLYLTGPDAALRPLAKLDVATMRCVLIVGHNPSLSTLATMLTGEYVALGTAEAAVLSVDADTWKEAGGLPGTWELEGQVVPS